MKIRRNPINRLTDSLPRTLRLLRQGTLSFKIGTKEFLGPGTFSLDKVPGRSEQVTHSTYHLVQTLHFTGKEAKARRTHQVNQLVTHATCALLLLFIQTH